MDVFAPYNFIRQSMTTNAFAGRVRLQELCGVQITRGKITNAHRHHPKMLGGEGQRDDDPVGIKTVTGFV